MRIQPIFFDKNVRITLSNEFRTGQPESKLILTLCLPFECSKLQLHSEGRFYGFYGKFSYCVLIRQTLYCIEQ